MDFFNLNFWERDTSGKEDKNLRQYPVNGKGTENLSYNEKSKIHRT